MPSKAKNTIRPKHSEPKDHERGQQDKPAPAENPEYGYADPLSTTTREERRNLLISDVALIAFVWGSLIPTKVEALGITLESSERYYLIALMFGINVYFMMAFWLYARVDGRVWLISYARAESRMWEAFSPANQRPDDPGRAYKLGGPPNELPEEFEADPEIFFRAWKIGQKVYHHRRLFDIYFPILLTALIWLACIVKLIIRGM